MAEMNSTQRTKLTEHEVALIAEMLDEGMTLREIAARFDQETSNEG